MPLHDTRQRIASVDIGSNSVLLLIAERDAPDTPWRTLADHAHITRISEGLDATQRLHDAPIERTAQCLARYAEIALQHDVDRVIATGTGPFRRARNGARAALHLSAALGASIDVISGEHEAELSRLATTLAFPELHEMVIADIGGASTEIIHQSPTHSPTRTSLDIGSVRLAERRLHSDPPSPDERAHLVDDIQAALRDDPVTHALAHSHAPLVGIAGTVTTVAALHLALQTYDAQRIHGLHLTRDLVHAIVDDLFRADLETRLDMPGLEPKRADVIPAGAQLLLSLLEHLDTDTLIISERGTRWGRLFEVMGDVGSQRTSKSKS